MKKVMVTQKSSFDVRVVPMDWAGGFATGLG